MIPYLLGGATAVLSSLSFPALAGLGGVGLLAADQAGLGIPGLEQFGLGPLSGVETIALAAIFGGIAGYLYK